MTLTAAYTSAMSSPSNTNFPKKSDDNITPENTPRCARLGRSPFWMHLEPEPYGASGVNAWRTSITYKPPRRRNVGMGAPLIDISPRHPVFTLRTSGESFPLVVTECITSGRGANVELRGTRRIYLKELHVIDFSIKLRPVSTQTATQISVQFKCTVNPPLPKTLPGDLKIELCSPMPRPEPWCFPYAPATHAGSALLWSEINGVSVSCVLPDVETSDDFAPGVGVTSTRDSGILISHTVKNCVSRGKGAYSFSIRLDQIRTRHHAQFMHLRHNAELHEPAMPKVTTEQLPSLRARAAMAIARISDKSAYHQAGIERVYYKPEMQGHRTEFSAGFPHFPLDGARAMLDWDRLMGDEDAARLAILLARGIGTDFSVILADAYGHCANKGAFWDRRHTPAGSSESAFTDFLGDDFHSIASTARIATGLFRVYQLTGDPISVNAGINACQWLLLKQNAGGYFDGDRVDGSTGAIVHEPSTLVGIEVINALLHAYYSSGNEIYIKAAHRIERHLMEEIVPKLSAPSIYRKNHHLDEDTPVSVASLIKALAAMNTLLTTRRSAEDVENASIWLKSWDLTKLDRLKSVNHDGHFDGLYEIARSALSIAATTDDPTWLQIALSVGAALPREAWDGWQAVPLFAETMLSLVKLVKGSTINLANLQANASWSDFAPDASTYKYLNVVALPQRDTEEVQVDFMPLVSRIDGRVLIPVLAHGSAETIQVIQNNRTPNLRDLATGEIVCQPAPLHKLPFDGPWRWGCFTIDP